MVSTTTLQVASAEMFQSYLRELKVYTHLKELHINNIVDRLPAPTINTITTNTPQLQALGFSFVRFRCDAEHLTTMVH